MKQLVFDQNTTITHQQNVISTLQATVTSQKQTNLAHELKIGAQEQEIKTQKQDLETQKREIEAQKQKMSAQENTTIGLQTDMTTLRQAVADVSHVEVGSVYCGQADSWKDGFVTSATGWGYYHSKTVSSKFSRTYTQTPVVFVAVSGWDNRIQGGDDRINQGAVLTHVDTTGFTAACATDFNTVNVGMEISWISVAQ